MNITPDPSKLAKNKAVLDEITKGDVWLVVALVPLAGTALVMKNATKQAGQIEDLTQAERDLIANHRNSPLTWEDVDRITPFDLSNSLPACWLPKTNSPDLLANNQTPRLP